MTAAARPILLLSLAFALGCDAAAAPGEPAPTPMRGSEEAAAAAERRAAASEGTPARGSADGAAGPTYASVRIDGVPHVRQRPDFCGEACAAMWLARLGQTHTQDDVFNLARLDPLSGRGCHTKELARAVQAAGFRTGPVWHRIGAAAAGAELERAWSALHADLADGVPSIVCMHYDGRPDSSEHFRLMLGYDARSDEVLYHEPAEAAGAYRRLPRAEFLQRWPLKYDPLHWTLIRLRLESEALVAPRRTPGFSDADYAQHVRQLKGQLPSRDFHVTLARPFVVVGDEPAATVGRRAEATVGWAVERLKRTYFRRDPRQIVTIWLFKDKASYERNATALFGDKPSTPFGYYSSRHAALVMNISTGGGTLVHEIVHPFVEADFPKCPAWLNEGLGSLYEQCGDRAGQITGFTNWRLAGLQRAIGAGRVPSFHTLCSTTRNQFYNEDPGTNYAQARYLCYYLQEHDLLAKFYEQFRAGWREDPTGYATLQKLLDVDDMEAFQEGWEAYVLKLRFN